MNLNDIFANDFVNIPIIQALLNQTTVASLLIAIMFDTDPCIIGSYLIMRADLPSNSKGKRNFVFK